MVETPMSLACMCSLYSTFTSMLHHASTLSELKVPFCFWKSVSWAYDHSNFLYFLVSKVATQCQRILKCILS